METHFFIFILIRLPCFINKFKKKIKRAVENNDNVKGINVISSFFERREHLSFFSTARLTFFQIHRNVIKPFIYFHKSQRVRHH
jgi:hypothetical protein